MHLAWTAHASLQRPVARQVLAACELEAGTSGTLTDDLAAVPLVDVASALQTAVWRIHQDGDVSVARVVNRWLGLIGDVCVANGRIVHGALWLHGMHGG